jgi:hypothetical protein
LYTIVLFLFYECHSVLRNHNAFGLLRNKSVRAKAALCRPKFAICLNISPGKRVPRRWQPSFFFWVWQKISLPRWKWNRSEIRSHEALAILTITSLSSLRFDSIRNIWMVSGVVAPLAAGRHVLYVTSSCLRICTSFQKERREKGY